MFSTKGRMVVSHAAYIFSLHGTRRHHERSSADCLHTMVLLLYIHQFNHQNMEDLTGAKHREWGFLRFMSQSMYPLVIEHSCY